MLAGCMADRDLEFFQIEPLSDTIRNHAHALGYTELHFNPQTMGWSWHKPDQVLGADGRLYVMASRGS
jgi:hypothetical protein